MNIEEVFNAWREETGLSSLGMFRSENYTAFKSFPAHQLFPFIIEKLRYKPSLIVHALEEICPLLKNRGYYGLRSVCGIYINFWDSVLSLMGEEEIDRTCEDVRSGLYEEKEDKKEIPNPKNNGPECFDDKGNWILW